MLDFTTALLTPDGEVMAQGRTNALHLGSIMYALEGIRAKFGDDMHPGDIFVNNDPYEGGSHLPDLFILKPLFVEGRLVAFSGAEAHMSDIGGRVPGSNAADSTEIYQEGLRIPPSRLAIRGEPNETLWDLIAQNVRQPHRVDRRHPGHPGGGLGGRARISPPRRTVRRRAASASTSTRS